MKKILIVFLLGVAIALTTILVPRLSHQKCRHGHLDASASECSHQMSSIRFLSLGWDYHLAKGKVNPVLCETTKQSTQSGRAQGFGSVNTVFKPVPCENHFKNFSGLCIRGEEGSDVALVAMDDQCVNGVFFNGHGRDLINDEIVPL